MSGLALWVGRDGRPADRDNARVMAAAGGARGAARETRTATAIALHLDGGEEPTLSRSSPLLDADASLILVADARIDNRHDLAARLGVPAIASGRDDPALLLHAYRTWGEAFADHLSGDFAVAIWDGVRRRLLAARDVFAMRPLYYRVESGRMLVASEVCQILSAKDVPGRVFEPMVAAALARSPGLPGWSFYQGIERVPPGQTLIADDAGIRWHAHAPLAEDGPSRTAPAEAAGQLREGLRGAVQERLEAAPSPGLLLSGGLDSTSVAGMAGVLYQGGAVPARIRAYGFAYSELADCDEMSVSEGVTSHYGFPSVPAPADTAWPLAEHPAHGPDIDAPDRLRSHVLLDRATTLARRDGVTTLMSGYRGDALCGGQVVDYLGALSDVGVAGWWRDVGAHARRLGTGRAALLERHLLRRIPAAVWPRGEASRVRRQARDLVPGDAQIPPWLRSDTIRRLGLGQVIGQEAPRSRLRGEARRRRHDHILNPSDGRNAEAVERMLARRGLRYTDPWADRELAALVLRLPQHVITPAGEPKRLLREAMRGILPEHVRLAARKRPPGSLYLRGLAERSCHDIRSLMAGSRVAALGLVDESVLTAAYERYVAQPLRVGERQWRWLWRFVDVEDWLRRYHA